jgi:hypothetical protein
MFCSERGLVWRRRIGIQQGWKAFVFPSLDEVVLQFRTMLIAARNYFSLVHVRQVNDLNRVSNMRMRETSGIFFIQKFPNAYRLLRLGTSTMF